jgi:hypothetical protein
LNYFEKKYCFDAFQSPDSSLRVFISKEQTKETDEGDKSNSVVYGRCVQRPYDRAVKNLGSA